MTRKTRKDKNGTELKLGDVVTLDTIFVVEDFIDTSLIRLRMNGAAARVNAYQHELTKWEPPFEPKVGMEVTEDNRDKFPVDSLAVAPGSKSVMIYGNPGFYSSPVDWWFIQDRARVAVDFDTHNWPDGLPVILRVGSGL